MSSDREEHSQVRVRQFAAVNLDGHHFPEAAIGRLVAAADLDLEDEWCDPASGAWRPLWVLDGVPRPLHWDALQRRHGGELAERRRRVEAGELARKAYIDWRALQLRLLASEGAATVVGQEGPPPAQDDVDLMWLLGQVPKHIRDLYPPVRELGRGGSGRVYLVKQRHSEALCALKLTRAGLGKQAVLNELKALERVRSQHVVSVRHYEPIDEGEDGRWLIVSEYVDGPTLQQYRLERPDKRVSDPAVLRDLLLGMARGLADLHRHGVVHRDLKPANVVLRGGVSPGMVPMPVIIDLGMSRGTGGMTLLGGTPGYQSPEQEEGERCSPASDVFVFGLVAYELVTGRRLAGARLQRLHEACPGLPPSLDELVKERCAIDEVSERLADGTVLLEALEAAFKRAQKANPGPREHVQGTRDTDRGDNGDSAAAPSGEDAGASQRSEPDSPGLRSSDGALGELGHPKDAGTPEHMLQMGRMFELGSGVERDLSRAAAWFRLAADRGEPLGMFEWGRVLEQGIGVTQNSTDAVKWLRRAAEEGVPEAMLRLGSCIQKGMGIEQSQQTAAEWYLKAAELGNAQAMHLLSECVEQGIRAAGDRSTSLQWLQRSAEAGHVGAMVKLGAILQGGQGVLRHDGEAATWLRRAADAGSDDAMNRLGVMLRAGRGVGPDDAVAVEWFRRSAECGNAEAMNNLGECLVQGDGTRRNERAAYDWFLRSGKLGCVRAMFNLGRCFEGGSGVVKDLDAALDWYRRAARAGCGASMYRMGKINEALGMRDGAIECYRHGMKAGNADAADALRRLRGFWGSVWDGVRGR